jgi:hypothetical protein
MSRSFTLAAYWRGLIGVALCGFCLCSTARSLDLKGYIHESGAITVQHHGDTIDPYFALQAIELAQSRGLDVSAVARPWARWLAEHYQASGHLGRYCRSTDTPAGKHTWYWCKAPDADDASLALWWQFLNRLPAKDKQDIGAPTLLARAQQELRELLNLKTGVYTVSRHIPHSLFMDNLEVWSVWPSAHLRKTIQSVFWDMTKGTYRVTTQTEYKQTGQAFYPDGTAQIYPLLVAFPELPGGAAAHYQRWMRQYRSAWLTQIGQEFPWGVIALIAWEQGDLDTVRCWQTLALPWRHTPFWTVTDEVVTQILPPLTPTTAPKESCS